MNPTTALSYVDHTLLKPDATTEQITLLCKEAVENRTAAVCVNPRYVPLAASLLKGTGKVRVCTVIGFPLGASTTACKVFEAQDALKNGADEIDMVISIGDLKEGKYDDIQAEIQAVKQAIGSHTLKVIIETCLLTNEEKVKMCQVVAAAGADYIKTSTGFSTSGATAQDVALLARETKGKIKVKAAGGISSYGDMELFISLGAHRLGSSSAVRIVKALGKK